jgi:hypothetical protein
VCQPPYWPQLRNPLQLTILKACEIKVKDLLVLNCQNLSVFDSLLMLKLERRMLGHLR